MSLFALLCAAAGDELVLVARRRLLLERLSEEIGARRSGQRGSDGRPVRRLHYPTVVATDFRDETSGRRLVDATLSAHGRLDIVVYAA